MIPLLCVALSCAAPTPSDSEVVRGYRLFGWGDCDAVRAQADAMDYSAGAEREPFFQLLKAYCLELDGDTAAAKVLYSSIIERVPRTTQAFEAALRLRELERLEHLGREELNQQVKRAWKSPRYEHAVRPIQRIEPKYPSAVFAAGIEGWVLVDFEISGEGAVVDPMVLDSDPPFVFDGAALAATRHWVYEPSEKADPIRATVRLNFDIER